MPNDEVDEFGLPTRILEDNREVVGQEPPHEFVLNLLEQPSELDKLRIIMRCGTTIIIQEMWQNGIVTLHLRTEKGQRPFAVYDPNMSGLNAMKVMVPTDIL